MSKLDAVHSPAQLEAFSVEAYLDELRAALDREPGNTLASLDAVDRGLRDALAAVDAFASTVARIGLEVAVADAVQAPFRRTLAATVLQYEHDRDTLRDRVASAVGRTDPGRAADVAEAVCEVAARALATRAALRDGVIAIARELAARHLPGARKASWDRSQPDAVQARWAEAVRVREEFLEVPHEEEPRVEATRGAMLEFD